MMKSLSIFTVGQADTIRLRYARYEKKWASGSMILLFLRARGFLDDDDDDGDVCYVGWDDILRSADEMEGMEG